MNDNHEKEFFKLFEKSTPDSDSMDLYGPDDELDEYAELGELILRLQDKEISNKDFTRLQQWLMTDSGAMDYYAQYAYLTAGLHILFNKKHDISFLNHLVKA